MYGAFCTFTLRQKKLRRLFVTLILPFVTFLLKKLRRQPAAIQKSYEGVNKSYEGNLKSYEGDKKTQCIYDFARFRTLEKSYEEPKKVTKGIEKVTKALRNFFESPS